MMLVLVVVVVRLLGRGGADLFLGTNFLLLVVLLARLVFLGFLSAVVTIVSYRMYVRELT